MPSRGRSGSWSGAEQQATSRFPDENAGSRGFRGNAELQQRANLAGGFGSFDGLCDCVAEKRLMKPEWLRLDERNEAQGASEPAGRKFVADATRSLESTALLFSVFAP